MARIAVDAMGGDRGPPEVVRGALSAARERGVQVILVGRSAALRVGSARHVEVVEAPQVVEMGEAAALSVRRKPDSSIAVGLRLVRDGAADAFVSMGNSGAIVAGAVVTLGLVKGVLRPALGAVLRALGGPVLLLDVGANTTCRPEHLVQFARMGSLYLQRVRKVPRPRVALLSSGEEANKGTPVVREAHALLRETPGIDFVGNVEGKDVPQGTVDVVVTDGFTGNVLLKASEGLSEVFYALLKRSFKRAIHYRVAGLMLRPALRRMARHLDYTQYGGAPLLGVRGTVVTGHGRSDWRAIATAILVADQEARAGLSQVFGDFALSGLASPVAAGEAGVLDGSIEAEPEPDATGERSQESHAGTSSAAKEVSWGSR